MKSADALPLFSLPVLSLPVLSLPALCLALSGCGASAPPEREVKPAAPSSWAQLVPQVEESVGGFKAKLDFELWLASTDEPSLELIEARLSRSSVLADVNGSESRYQVTIGEMSCEATWSAAPSAEAKARAQGCAAQLKADHSALIAQAGGLIRVSCTASDSAQALSAHQVTSALARDLEAQLALPSARLCRNPDKPKSFSVSSFVQVKTEARGEALSACTVGLKAFGQPEVCLSPVDSSREAPAREALLSIADSSLRGAPIKEGLSVSRGPATGLLVSASRHGSLSALGESLVVVDPSAAPDDQGAQAKLMMRFTLP